MIVNNRIPHVFKAVVVLLLLSSASLFGQNLIINGDFEQISGFDYNGISDYERIFGGGVHEGQFIHDVNSTGHGPGDLGWPNNLKGYGDSGYYLLFNGFGGNLNPSKVAWHQTVTVTPNTIYVFSAQVRNLAQSVFGFSPNPAQLRLKINGQQVGDDLPLPQHNNWSEWSNSWSSGSATQANIEIFDVFTGEAWTGDDFGIDHISFTPQATYSVNAVDDNVSLCVEYFQTYQIEVLDNDLFSPSSQMQGATVQIIQNAAHGNVSWNNNTRKVQYMFTDGTWHGGMDQFKYRVTIPHGESAEAWVYINVGRDPDVGWIDPPGPICAGGELGIAVPSVEPDQGSGQWVCCQNQNGTFTPFDASNVPLSMDGWYVKFMATNDCGNGYSNTVQISVTNGPSWASGQAGQTPQIQPICAGTNLTLTPPTYNSNNMQILSQGWVIAPTENGTYNTFSLNSIPADYNGWYVCYMVESTCGYIYSNPKRQLVVNVVPDVTGTLQVPDAICVGDDLELTIPTYSGTGTGSWEICQTPSGTYQTFNPQGVPVTYNNWYIHYKVSNDCGSDVSNAVQIHVYDAPTIATPTTPPAICANNSFNLTTPTIQNNGSTITDQGWQIAATQNGTYNAFNNNNVPYTYNGYWIRYFAENDCGETHSASVQITVNDEPVVGNITAPAGICAGQSFNLTTPQVDWRHTNQGTGSWEIAPTSSGEFTTLNNNGIPYLYNGYYIRYKAVNGCGTAYSTNVVQVTVFSTEPTYDTITACDTYIWNNVTCNQTGDYQATVQNANGCTITAHLHFNLSDAYTETQIVSECNSYYWPKNGETYNSSGSYEYTVESGDPMICDSIFTLNLTINNAPEILENITALTGVCAGSPMNLPVPQYALNHANGGDAHWEYATSANGPFTAFDPSANTLGYGTYYLRFAVINDCDEAYSNVVAFHVDDVPEALMQLSGLQVCEGQSLDLPEINVNWNNEDENDRVAQWQMDPSQYGNFATIDPNMPIQMSHDGYWLRFVAHNSCGDAIVGPVPITVIFAGNQWLETITACDSYTLESGEVITQSQVVEYEVYEPCFHLVYQPVEINHSDYVVEPITSCHEEYEWHGRTFYHSEQIQYAWDTLTNANLCDSIVELNLSFDEYSSFTHNRTACDFFIWDMKPDQVYTESVRDSIFVPAVGPDDCDTWYYLNLTLGHNTMIDGGMMTECSGFVWHGVPYYEDAVIYDSLQTSVTHCDSIIIYQLSIIVPIESDINIESCQPLWWQEHYCEEEGDYQHVFESAQGCDSIVTMHFSITPEIVMPTVDILTCGPYYWNEGQQYIDEEGLWSHTFQTPQGCDSTVYLNVTFNETKIQPESISACDSYEFHGVVYDQPGDYQIYYDTVFTQNGCIETVKLLNLTISNSEQLGTISGGSYVFVASNLVSGIYRYELDATGVLGDIVWSLSNPEWQIVEENDNYCRIFVGMPGSATLSAQFMTSSCGLVIRSFEINAGFFGVADYEVVVANVYPNPTKGTVTVEANGIENVRLTNMMGQVLDWREYDRSDEVILNLNGFAPSVYLLEIKTVNGIVKKRVMVSR